MPPAAPPACDLLCRLADALRAYHARPRWLRWRGRRALAGVACDVRGELARGRYDGEGLVGVWELLRAAEGAAGTR